MSQVAYLVHNCLSIEVFMLKWRIHDSCNTIQWHMHSAPRICSLQVMLGTIADSRCVSPTPIFKTFYHKPTFYIRQLHSTIMAQTSTPRLSEPGFPTIWSTGSVSVALNTRCTGRLRRLSRVRSGLRQQGSETDYQRYLNMVA